jgi:hypothetical protein
MGLFDFITNRGLIEQQSMQLKEQGKVLLDLKAAINQGKERTHSLAQEIKTRRRTLQKPLQYATSDVRAGDRSSKRMYYGPLYDLGEIGRAVDVEPYIRVSIRKHREQILKEGYEIQGSDPEMVEYIKKRLFEMVLMTGVTTDQWLRDYTTNLITYATSFLVLKRDLDKSSGSEVKWHGKRLKPIAGIFPLDPTSVSVSQNEHGHPVKWMQNVEEAVGNKNVKTFDASEIVVSTLDKKTGFVFGTPYILPTLDDIRALRRIEEIVELIAQSHAWPSVQWKVGEKGDGPQEFDDGTTEIDYIRAELQAMPTEAGIVTSHRVEAQVLGMEGQALDLNGYLNHFKTRVMEGLRLSPEDLGQSAGSKASAVTVSQSLQDSSKDIQAVISDTLTYSLFLPLLLEGGFDVTKDNIVKLIFPLINREEDRARQSHGNDLYLAGSISKTEFRNDWLNREEHTEEECKDCVPEQKHEFDMELAKVAAAAKAASQANSANKSATKKSDNTTRPKNQSGQKAAKTRVTKNDRELYRAAIIDTFRATRVSLRDFIDRHGVGFTDSEDPLDLTTKQEELDSILVSFVTYGVQNARIILNSSMQRGISDAVQDMGLEIPKPLSKRSIDRFYKNTIQKSLSGFIISIHKAISESEGLIDAKCETHPAVVLSSILDLHLSQLEDLTNEHVDLATRFGYAKSARINGYDSIIMEPDESDSCSECQDFGRKVISLTNKDIPYSTLLKTHDLCGFHIHLGEKN